VLDATGDDQLRALGLSLEHYRNRFRRLVLIAAAVHDLGKANDHFQGMIQNCPERDGRPQGLRHEWVTWQMLEQPDIRGWLLPAVAGDVIDWQFVLWAVAGHHPAYDRASPPKQLPQGSGAVMALPMDHADYRRCLDWLAETFGLSLPPTTSVVRLPLAGVFSRIIPWFAGARVLWERLSDPDRRLVAAVKSCLIAADVAGSALPREVKNLAKQDAWIGDALARTPPPGRIQQIVNRRRGPNPLFAFQQAVAASMALVTFVRGGCGSGKTLAAYQWAATQHPGRRLYFCYPTTGTATEGYRDYLHVPEEEFDADLFHGRAAVDLEIILGVRTDDDPREEDGTVRIESLDSWSTPIVACTVDTVLGLVQNNRRGLFAWPALAGAAFVFDEIHAYDERLFGALLHFLEALPGAPVLLMTASLPAARLQKLREVLRKRNLELPVLPTQPLESELWKRYHRQEPLALRNPLPEIQQELARGGKVLWVCNTVDRTIAAAENARGLRPRIYHSRFRYEDRVRRHKEVVDAFDPKTTGGVLACCTQVAEMSLDLKGVTLLVTELAPVPALIQRLGRLNRQATADTPSRPFIVIEPEGSLPYTDEELEAARAWLAALGEGSLSQDDLATGWEGAATDNMGTGMDFKWLDGGPSTEVGELRKPSPGITVALQRDEAALRVGRLLPARAALPMPPPRGRWKAQWRSWSEVRGLLIAPADAIQYDEQRGAKWHD